MDRSSSGRFSHDLIPMVFGEKSADAKIAQCDFGDTIPRERASGFLVLHSCFSLSFFFSLFPSSFPRYSRVITHADALRAYYAPCNASYTVYYHGTRCHFSRCAARARNRKHGSLFSLRRERGLKSLGTLRNTVLHLSLSYTEISYNYSHVWRLV